MFEPIDIYCERLDTSFWAEPINAITNLAFIIASFLAIYIHKKDGLNNKVFIFLSLLVGLIGVGSFLFHTYANTWSSLADTIPIWSFVVLYVLFVIRTIFHASWFKTARIMIIVFILAYLGFTLANSEDSGEKILNGSLQYAPALFFMLVFAFSLYFKRRTLYKYAISAVLVFFISLCFRTVDIYVCQSISLGTHFMWHILNGLMLFLLLLTMHKAIKEDKKN